MSYTIGQLARAADSDVETIRYYERRGLMPAPPRGANGYRHYPPAAADRLRCIRRAKRLGCTLAETRDLLSLHDGAGARAEGKDLARKKLADLDERLADLARMREALADLEARCSGRGPVQGCPIIQALSDEEATS